MNFGKLSLKIEMRLSELAVAKTLSEISPNPPPRRHKMSNMANTLAVDLSKNWRMLLKSEGEDDPDRVTEITIVGIVDYH
jgi:proteic killer suppression protein